MNDKDDDKCTSGFHCGNQATEPHPCPYREEINDDSETLCTCCQECAQECANDI